MTELEAFNTFCSVCGLLHECRQKCFVFKNFTGGGINMKLKIKLEEGAFTPLRAHTTDAGLDLRSPVDVWVHPGEEVKIDTLVRLAIPDGYYGLIASKSGLMLKGITCRGVIDSSYRGTVNAVLFNHGKEGYAIHAGDKVCQIIISPIVIPDLEFVDELDETERNECGFGSSGR